MDHALAALAVEVKIRDALREGRLDKAPGDVLLDQAVEAGIITGDERQQVLDADVVRNEVSQVDSCDPGTFRSLRGGPFTSEFSAGASRSAGLRSSLQTERSTPPWYGTSVV